MSSSDPRWYFNGPTEQWPYTGIASPSGRLPVPGYQSNTAHKRVDSAIMDPNENVCDPRMGYFDLPDQSVQLNAELQWMSALTPSIFGVDPGFGSSSQPHPSPSGSRSTDDRVEVVSVEPDTEPDDWEPTDLRQMGYVDNNGHWRCRFETCKSDKVFLRVCDLRKHYGSHLRRYFCSEPTCEWATVGFSNSKDCRRHEQSHNPQFRCPAMNCDRIFGRSGMIVVPEPLC